MWTKRIKDLVAMLLIGDGALTLIAARNRALVWRFGPERLRKSTSWQADHPFFMRLEGIASIAIGIWLALGQYRQPPRQLVAGTEPSTITSNRIGLYSAILPAVITVVTFGLAITAITELGRGLSSKLCWSSRETICGCSPR